MLNRKTLKRMVSRLLYSPLAAERSLGILTYHSVGNGARVSLNAKSFADHMRFIISTDRFKCVDWQKKIGQEKDKLSVLVTFDDGYLDNYETALPILNDLGIRALFFITTGFIENGKPAPESYGAYCGLKPMTWDHINRLIELGHSVGHHGHTHRNWGAMSNQEALDEMSHSAERFRQNCGFLPNCFAYPFGQFEHRRADMLEIAKKFGIKYVFSTENRIADIQTFNKGPDISLIPRLRVDANDSVRDVLEMLEGRRDYIARIQKLRSFARTHSLAALGSHY